MARDYVEQIKALLPRGAAWTRAIESVAHTLYLGVSREFDRIDARAEALLLEMDPRTCTETIESWERIVGLPDACSEIADTIEARRLAVYARWIARGGWSGGSSAPFLTALIVALGYLEADILIRRFYRRPFTCESACTDPMQERDWLFAWEFVVISSETDGDDERLMCEVDRYAQAHLGLVFAFPLVQFEDGTFERAGAAVFIHPRTGNQAALASNEMADFYLGV